MRPRSSTPYAVPASFFVPRNSLFQTTAFRWTLGIAAIVAMSILLMGGFFYWQTVIYLTLQVDRSLASVADAFTRESPDNVGNRIAQSLQADPRRRKAFGLFDPAGRMLTGNVPVLPTPLPDPDDVSEIEVLTIRQNRTDRITVRAIAKRLANGDILFLGLVVDELQEIRAIITRAMALAVVPTAILALVGGAAVSIGTLRRVEAVRRACMMIMEGHLDRRLPVRSKKDEFDRLSEIVNRMLDDIERLILEAKVAGDAIAHDVRTPLTRLRARLERAMKTDLAGADVPALLEKSTADIDQLLTTITAILRIAEVEQGRRRSGFACVDLEDILTAVSELYAPIAEEKGVGFSLDTRPVPAIRGDGDLLFELVGNLVDNAVKFTPPGGRVALALQQRSDRIVAVVRDTGPGIPIEEREAVLRRFYRGDRSRSQPGTGLGLSFVAAVARLHGFELTITDASGGGCEVTLECEAGTPGAQRSA